MMDLRHWLLAGVAATTLSGTAPAFAQAPRSLFEQTPTNMGAAPVTMGLQASLPAKADSAAPALKPTQAPEKAAEAPSRAPAAKPRSERRRLASRGDATPTIPSEPAPGFAAATATPTAGPQATEAPKPMTRTERRRARLDARRQAAAPEATPQPAIATNPFQTLFGAQPAQERGERLAPVAGRGQIDALVSHHARLNSVPEALVHRVIVRESKYNPRAVGRGGAMGLMQIKTATARGVGYTGGPAGLLDAETNLTYAVKYLAGAWRVSGGSHDRAVSNYARGYYYEAKRQGLGPVRGRRGRGAEPEVAAAPQQPTFFSLFSQQASNQ